MVALNFHLGATSAKEKAPTASTMKAQLFPNSATNIYPDARELKQQASYRWLDLINHLAPQANEAIGKLGRHVACPVHGGSDGFRLFKDADQTGGGICNTCGSFSDGFALLQWLNDWSFSEALQAVSNYLTNNTALGFKPHTASPTKPEPPNQKAARKITQQWECSVLIDWEKPCPVSRYLIQRGLESIKADMPDDLRLAVNVNYWEGKKLISRHPAIVAAVRSPAGELVNVHRTYLTGNGQKANVPSNKKMMPSPVQGITKGAAIRLYPAGEVLCVAEGIETALAVRLACGLPVWAARDALGMARLQVPDNVREVRIYADNDANQTGHKAAKELAARLKAQGKRALIALPAPVGTDWLDVLNAEGLDK